MPLLQDASTAHDNAGWSAQPTSLLPSWRRLCRPCSVGVPLLLWDFENLLDARLVWVQQWACFHMLGDKLAACPWDVLPVTQHSQGQVLICLLLLTCVGKRTAEL